MSAVDHPPHYGGEDNPYEVIKVIEAWKLGFHLGTAVKYIPRAGVKDPSKEIEDLEKAVWYINRKIELLRAAQAAHDEYVKTGLVQQPLVEDWRKPLIVPNKDN